jgi:DNA adenine methylase
VAKPFFKWAGGKQSLVPQLLPLLPKDADKRRHVEPFLGSGALFFAREPKRALLSDVNAALINTYYWVQAEPRKIVERLKRHLSNHTEALYYSRRDKFNNGARDSDKAVLFLYLNKTCFNGLYRVNSDGAFNVPSGQYENPTLDREVVLQASVVLAGSVHVCVRDFERIADFVNRDDFVYLDPPLADSSPAAAQCDQRRSMRTCKLPHARWSSRHRRRPEAPRSAACLRAPQPV